MHVSMTTTRDTQEYLKISGTELDGKPYLELTIGHPTYTDRSILLTYEQVGVLKQAMDFVEELYDLA